LSQLSIEIVRATPEHEGQIAPLMQAYNHVERIPWRPEAMIPALRRVLHEPALGLAVVARDRETARIVGYGLGTFGFDLEFAGPDSFVMELYVEPALRRRGIGRQLLETMVTLLAQAGANAVHLLVRPENREARALYAAQGFEDVPRLMMTRLLAPAARGRDP
jgi:ribosomal protein S18 acetylase RimI-like enzyme